MNFLRLLMSVNSKRWVNNISQVKKIKRLLETFNIEWLCVWSPSMYWSRWVVEWHNLNGFVLFYVGNECGGVSYLCIISLLFIHLQSCAHVASFQTYIFKCYPVSAPLSSPIVYQPTIENVLLLDARVFFARTWLSECGDTYIGVHGEVNPCS